MKTKNRLIVTTSDIEIIMGCTPRSARRYLQRLREDLGKKPEHFITFKELAHKMGVQEEEIYNHLLQK